VKAWVLSCAGKEISPSFLSDLETLLTHWNITIYRQEQTSLKTLRALDLYASSPSEIDLEKFKLALMKVSDAHQTDVAFLEDSPSRANKKLIVFDMDSTLIQHEVIDEMALVYGIGAQVKLITERAMNGEINFNEALRERVALLKGLKRQDMEAIYHRLKLTPGASELIFTLKSYGYKTAIVSGGFKYFAEAFAQRLGVDYVYANDLDWEGDVLTGTVAGEIVNAEKKAALLDYLAEKEQITLEQIVAVGDGANDLLMLAKAGMGIAYHAKEKVKLSARHQMSFGPLTTILYFLGFKGDYEAL
jgi:phosphoserine phosphatase